MSQPGFDYLSAIASHSEGLADAAAHDLDASIEHCPGWDMAALVGHMIEVHWFWGTIVRERLQEPPDETRRPATPPRHALIETMREGSHRLVESLREADQSAAVWTWAATQHDVAFVTRHQVQEAAVHHWDAGHAIGREVKIEEPVAIDSIEEFLRFSLSTEEDPATPPRPSLGGRFVLASTAGPSWTLEDGSREGAIRVLPGAASGVAAITATPSDLLLWLYGRKQLDTGAVSDELQARFRSLCFTD